MSERATKVVFDAWDNYAVGTKSGPMFISFDVEAARNDLTNTLPHCARVIIPIHDPNANGGPVEPESDRLWEMEDALCAVLSENSVECRLVGRLTNNGERELVFQLSDWESFRPPVGEWMGENNDYQIDVSKHEGWEFFNECIRPGPEDWISMADASVVRGLVKAGSDPKKEHDIERVFLGEPKVLQGLAEALAARGYHPLGTLDFDGGEIVMVKKMTLDLRQIVPESIALEQLATQDGAKCAGWGARVVK